MDEVRRKRLHFFQEIFTMFVFRRITVFCSSQRRRGKSKLMCINYGAVVKELLERTDQPGSTPVDAVFCFFVSFLPLFLTLFFFLAFFSLFLFLYIIFLYSYSCYSFFFLYSWSWTWINIYFKLKSGVLFWKGISKALDLHTGQAYDQIKTISSQDMSLLWNSRILVQFAVYCVFVSHDVN